MSRRAASHAEGRRRAGLLLPLFALRSAHDWGIGEIGDLPALATFAAAAGHRLLQLLPIHEMPAGERSPYAALSAFALDPIYVSMAAVEDFVAAGGEAALAPDERARLTQARAATAPEYDHVRTLKRRALEIAFARFLTEWRADSTRARVFRRFREAEASWLADYALYRACQERRGGRGADAREPTPRDAAPATLAALRAATEEARLFHEYVQWLAAEQWAGAHRAAAAAGVCLKGDLPFMVSRHSADLWAHQDQFATDAGIGAPPDAFNAKGQDWGLPAYRWEVMARDGYAWLRGRVAHAAALFDALRVDHVVGLYRMYVLASGRPPEFVPATTAEQLARGERLLTVIREAAGATEVIGEDLGSVPDYVRRSLARLGVPGYCVLRWEHAGAVFRDPATYPVDSVATSGTHDTSSLATWWESELDDAGRRGLAATPGFASLSKTQPTFTATVHAALLDGLYAAASDLVVIPFPDAYGGRERINTPATVGRDNWAYRLPWTIEELAGKSGRALRDGLAALAARHGR